MWAGVQNVSRPIERCYEMSQTTPTFALVAAISAAATYQGTRPDAARRGYAGVWQRSRLPVARAPGDQSLTAPLLEDLLHLLVRIGQGLLGRHPSRRRVREHGGQHERVEHLALGRVGRPGMADIRRPLQGRGDR